MRRPTIREMYHETVEDIKATGRELARDLKDILGPKLEPSLDLQNIFTRDLQGNWVVVLTDNTYSAGDTAVICKKDGSTSTVVLNNHVGVGRYPGQVVWTIQAA